MGLIGDGEIGVRGIGDFAAVVVDGTERLSASLGPRRASILIIDSWFQAFLGARLRGGQDVFWMGACRRINN